VQCPDRRAGQSVSARISPRRPAPGRPVAPDQRRRRRLSSHPREAGLPRRGTEMKPRGGAFTFAAAGLLAAALPPVFQTPAPPQPPRFQSSVDVTPVDVTVVDDRGQPVRDLAPADFVVRIDGNPRRVMTAEWVSLVTHAN